MNFLKFEDSNRMDFQLTNRNLSGLKKISSTAYKSLIGLERHDGENLFLNELSHKDSSRDCLHTVA